MTTDRFIDLSLERCSKRRFMSPLLYRYSPSSPGAGCWTGDQEEVAMVAYTHGVHLHAEPYLKKKRHKGLNEALSQ